MSAEQKHSISILDITHKFRIIVKISVLLKWEFRINGKRQGSEFFMDKLKQMRLNAATLIMDSMHQFNI